MAVSGSWDDVTGSVLCTLEGHTNNEISSVAVSSDSTKSVSGSCDTAVKVWDALTGYPLYFSTLILHFKYLQK
jgi:WD40 repeat protein